MLKQPHVSTDGSFPVNLQTCWLHGNLDRLLSHEHRIAVTLIKHFLLQLSCPHRQGAWRILSSSGSTLPPMLQEARASKVSRGTNSFGH
eukprot:1159567-Pelagomonas_calceolata.AAC.2